MMRENGDSSGESPASDPSTETFQSDYQPGDSDSLCEAVVRVIAVATGKEPTALDPLARTIDPEDMAALFRGRTDPDASLLFRYDGCEVTVRADGDVTAAVLSAADER